MVLAAPHALQEKIGASDPEGWFTQPDEFAVHCPVLYQMQRAFEAVLRRKPVLIESYVQLIVDSEGDWREHLREVAQGKKVTNQGRQFESNNGRSQIIIWERLNFRSMAERRIAEELDQRGVMFLPNCAARIGTTKYRHNKEPDFLVCHNGKWGILQVDGADFHPRAATDHEWDRQFLQHGVELVQHFTDRECREDPSDVVEKFLVVLSRPR